MTTLAPEPTEWELEQNRPAFIGCMDGAECGGALYRLSLWVRHLLPAGVRQGSHLLRPLVHELAEAQGGGGAVVLAVDGVAGAGRTRVRSERALGPAP